MFRARLSWTVVGGIGLLGLTRDLGVGVRGALLATGVAGFVALNRPLWTWVVGARQRGDAAWQPMAVGMLLRLVALALVVAFAW